MGRTKGSEAEMDGESSESSESQQCWVHDIHISGNKKTWESLIEREFEAAKGAENLDELTAALQLANARLQGLGVFEAVKIVLDAGPPELPGSVNILVHVKEKPRRVGAQFGTYRQGSNTFFEAGAKIRNLFGRAEELLVDAQPGLSSRLFQLGLDIPVLKIRAWEGDMTLRLYHLLNNLQRHASHRLRATGLSVGVMSGCHDVGYHLKWRSLDDPCSVASRAVRRDLGHDLVSSVKYDFSIDRRDNAITPTRGVALRLVTEAAGVGTSPDLTKFLRQEVEAFASIPLHRRLTFHLYGRAGAVCPWAWEHPRLWTRGRTSVADRFQLGGPSSFRGFSSNGLGPSDVRRVLAGGGDAGAAAARAGKARGSEDEPAAASGRDSLGGDLVLVGTAALAFLPPIPFMEKNRIHLHAFATSGTLAPLFGRGRLTSIDDLRKTLRVSYGAGVVLPTPFGRLEVNYCLVGKHLDHDVTVKQGLSFGVTHGPT